MGSQRDKHIGRQTVIKEDHSKFSAQASLSGLDEHFMPIFISFKKTQYEDT